MGRKAVSVPTVVSTHNYVVARSTCLSTNLASARRMTPDQDILPPGALRLLTSGFDLTEADVVADATQVATWTGPRDELLVGIENRYEWPAKTAARYLRNLLFALGQRPEGQAHA